MKIFLYLAVLVATISCKNHKNASAEAEAEVPTTDTIVMVVEQPTPKDTLVISFDKTPCFGRCPVYKIKIYASGFSTYEGINFAEKMGLYSTTFSQAQIEKIYRSALEIDYFNLDSEYNNPEISDLPSTISRINYNGKNQRIMARNNVPEKLKIFHETLAEILLGQGWQPYSNR